MTVPGAAPWLMAALLARIPEMPRAGNDPFSARPCPAARAAHFRYWTVAQPERVGVMMLDLDHGDPYGWLLEGMTLPPAFIIHHLNNGHSQQGWVLRDPIRRDKRRPERRFYDDVRADMTSAAQADAAFHGLALCSAPLGLEHGRLLEVVRPELTDLHELRAHVARPTSNAREVERLARHFMHDPGAGRNPALFEALRHVGYQGVREYLSRAQREAALSRLAVVENARFSVPLPMREVGVIIRSVLDWTDTHADELRGTKPATGRRGATYRLPGAARNCDRQAAQRVALTDEERAANLAASGRATGNYRREVTRARIRAAVTMIQGQGHPVTVAAIMTATGLSRRTVQSHGDLYRLSPGT